MNEFRGRGNLGATPELRCIEDGAEGRNVLPLRIYFDRLVPTREGQSGGFEDRGGFWLNASVWGRRAETLQPLLAKGMRVYVEGTLVQRAWQSRETGEDRVGMELEVDYLAIDPSRIARIDVRERGVNGEDGAPAPDPPRQEAAPASRRGRKGNTG
jgi:single-strand DNA-binding protein